MRSHWTVAGLQPGLRAEISGVQSVFLTAGCCTATLTGSREWSLELSLGDVWIEVALQLN